MSGAGVDQAKQFDADGGAPAPLHTGRPALRLGVVLTLAAFASSGTNLLITGIYFYMAHRYGWGLLQNFLLATGQGLVYIVGALNSHKVTQRLKPRKALTIVYALMAAISVAALLSPSAAGVTVLLLMYTIVSVISWPILESQVTIGTDSQTMSGRISIYNLVWAATGVAMLAVDGAIIQHWPAGVFLWPAAVHAITMLIVLFNIGNRHRAARDNNNVADESDPRPLPSPPPEYQGREQEERREQEKQEIAMRSSAPPVDHSTGLAHPPAEPELLRSRTLALWLSRLALPATYVVIYGLMALMPSLPVMQKLDATQQTLLGSIWMASRWVAFLGLGLTAWWHTRPRLLLAAAIVMLIAFIGVTVRPSDLLGHGSFTIDLLSMSLWQLALGVCMGIIYSCSLYFGMVLSDGSTEHGGYHEALIGLGQVLGPGAGAIAAVVRPYNVPAGITAVGAVIFLSTLAVIAASIIGGRRERSRSYANQSG